MKRERLNGHKKHRKRVDQARLNTFHDIFPNETPHAATHKASMDLDNVGDGPSGTNDPREQFLSVRQTMGRPLGATNRIPTALREAIMQAASEVGEDEKGLNGLVGYLRRLAIHEPSVFGSLLKRLLPVRVKGELDASSLLVQAMQAAQSRAAHDKARVLDLTPNSQLRDEQWRTRTALRS